MQLEAELDLIMRAAAKRGDEKPLNWGGYRYHLTATERKSLDSRIHTNRERQPVFPARITSGLITYEEGDLWRSPPAVATPPAPTQKSNRAKWRPAETPSEPPKVAPEPRSHQRKKEPAGAPDFMMWIGYQHYPTIGKFVNEALTMGVSKRISNLPDGLIPGKSRVFLVHDEGCFHYEEPNHIKVNEAVIFAYFVVDQVEVLVPQTDPTIAEWIEQGKLTPVEFTEARDEPERGCGWRTEPGAIYLRNEFDPTLRERAHKTSAEQKTPLHIKTTLVVLEPPLDYLALVDDLGTRFRSYRRCNGDILLTSDKTADMPGQRAVRTIGKDFRGAEHADSPWSAAERSELARLCVLFGPNKACKEFGRQTVRSYQAAMYQYRHHIMEREENDDDEA